MNFCAIRYHFLWVFHVFRSTLPHRSLAKLKFKSILIRRAAKVNIEARFRYIIFCPFPLTFSHQLSVLSLSQFLLCVFSHPFRGAIFILIFFCFFVIVILLLSFGFLWFVSRVLLIRSHRWLDCWSNFQLASVHQCAWDWLWKYVQYIMMKLNGNSELKIM